MTLLNYLFLGDVLVFILLGQRRTKRLDRSYIQIVLPTEFQNTVINTGRVMSNTTLNCFVFKVFLFT